MSFVMLAPITLQLFCRYLICEFRELSGWQKSVCT
ncbi:hypothetical protein C4J94_2890 [Pseudomonas sp. R5-89-07]|nr:hypothetical protein C4J94_2890 [Pseudomonas sp. R5-89-07]